MSEVLKSCGIDSHHKQFRQFLQQLFKACSKQWLQQPYSGVKTSTSEAMRALVMKHQSTVLKLKLSSPKNSTKKTDNVTSKQQKSVADVKKVLFTDNTPKFDFKFEKFGSLLKTNCSPIQSVSSEKDDNLKIFVDVSKLISSNNSENKPVISVSSTSCFSFSNMDTES